EGMSKDEVLIGAKVTLKDLDSQEILEYTLVSEVEADYAEGKISVTSPIGASLLNHKKKELVEIKVPAGILRYEIVEITR
ncbi:MAG: GreA/GreB family elongation factor, partial [Candidatus Omnitrophica bacterium]|nr:GreA/GreB family elongation factor [Candidatus Omnitrophota bacterium]